MCNDLLLEDNKMMHISYGTISKLVFTSEMDVIVTRLITDPLPEIICVKDIFILKPLSKITLFYI